MSDRNLLHPLSSQELEDLFDSLIVHSSVVVAVSGGIDSMALLHCLASWLKGDGSYRPQLHVATVDHDLRSGSGADAEFVVSAAGEYGLDAAILDWHGDKPSTNVQSTARQARYRLLLDHAEHCNASAIVTAHHLDDQAETFAMRLARGSGLDGLSAMAPQHMLDQVVLLRPLLEIPKARLHATLEAAGRTWVDDPSNADDSFERVRFRNAAPQLAELGLTTEAMARSARRLRRAREAIESYTTTELYARSELLQSLSETGHVSIRHTDLARLPDEIVIRMFQRLLSAIGGADAPIRLTKIEALVSALGGEVAHSWTLAGCQIKIGGEHVMIFREPGRSGLPSVQLDPGQRNLWDNRFVVSVSDKWTSPLIVAPLGSAGWRELADAWNADTALFPQAAQALPGFWRDEALIGVPSIGYWAPDLPSQSGEFPPFNAIFNNSERLLAPLGTDV